LIDIFMPLAECADGVMPRIVARYTATKISSELTRRNGGARWISPCHPVPPTLIKDVVDNGEADAANCDTVPNRAAANATK